MKKSFILLLMIIIISGCSAVDTTTNSNADISQLENKNINQLVESDEESDTSDWLTYKNEQFGINFIYPENYAVEVVNEKYEIRLLIDENKYIKLYKQIYKEAPEEDSISLSKESLDNLKKEAEQQGDINDSGIIFNSYYSISEGGGFYRGADVFINNDYIKMILSLESKSGIFMTDQDKVDSFLEQLNKKEVQTENDKEKIMVFDSIVQSIN